MGLSEKLIDEFEDVSTEEKIFMKLWNRHMRSPSVFADSQVRMDIDTRALQIYELASFGSPAILPFRRFLTRATNSLVDTATR